MKTQYQQGSICFAFLILGSFLSYAQSGYNPISMIGYFISIASLLATYFSLQKDHKFFRQKVTIFFVIFMLATIFSISLNALDAFLTPRIVQELIYPFSASIILLYGYRFFYNKPKIALNFIIILSITNFLAGFLGIFANISYIPIFGDIKTGRYIFGTSIPSSNGLMLNVNYFATAQLVFSFLYILIINYSYQKPKLKHWIVFFGIATTSLIGSSRGITLSLLSGLWVVLLISSLSKSKDGGNLAKLYIFLTVVIAFTIGFLFYEDFYSIFRLHRGLNARDEIWTIAIHAWLEKPFFGWSFNTGEAMGIFSYGEFEDKSTHSGYIHTLLRGGIISFIVVYGMVLYSIFCGLGLSRKAWIDHKWAVGAVVTYLVASGFRSYSFGGLGLLPLLASIALSLCLHGQSLSKVYNTKHIATNTPRRRLL